MKKFATDDQFKTWLLKLTASERHNLQNVIREAATGRIRAPFDGRARELLQSLVETEIR